MILSMSETIIRWRLLSFLATVIAASLLTGCSIPYSDHPLSDNKTSTVDDRLLGRWLQIDEDDEKKEEQKADEAGKTFEFMTVGLKKSNGKTMMMAYVELDDDGELTVERAFFFTTMINKQHYLSYQQKEEKKEEEEKKKITKYVIANYDLDESGLLTVHLMDNNKLVTAIEQGRVDGEIEIRIEQVNGMQRETKTAHLIASPEQLRRFLLETGTDCFNNEHPMKFQFLGRENREWPQEERKGT
jgi:hypothetical protein